MTFIQTMNAENRQLLKLGMVSDRKIEASHLRLSRIELFVVRNANWKRILTHEFEYNSHIQHTHALKVGVGQPHQTS